MRLHFFKSIILLIVAISLVSCTSLVRIRSNANDSEVYIDDNFAGYIQNNEIILELDNKQNTLVRLENPEYESFSGLLDHEVKIASILLSPLTSFISLIWLFGPVLDQTIELVKLPTRQATSQQQEQAQQQAQEQQQDQNQNQNQNLQQTIIIQVPSNDSEDDEN